MFAHRAFRLTSALLLCTLASPAFAVNRDMVQLQTQVQQLQDAVARLQQSNDERMGVLKDLVQQSADSINRMSLSMSAIQKQLATEQTAQGAKSDQISGQVQALNDSLDEMRTRMASLEKLLASVESQQQGIASSLQSLPGATSPAGAAPPTNTTTAPTTMNDAAPAPSAAIMPAAPATPPVGDLYKSAYNDYMAAHYSVAASEFRDVIQDYPDNNLAGNSWYYLAEMEYRAGKYSAAAGDYDKVLERFPGSSKIPAAHLHKAQALFALRQNDAGIRQLRTLIQRYPVSPEATQARTALSGMGVPVHPR